jgi:hypothetical protein
LISLAPVKDGETGDGICINQQLAAGNSLESTAKIKPFPVAIPALHLAMKSGVNLNRESKSRKRARATASSGVPFQGTKQTRKPAETRDMMPLPNRRQ